MKILDKQKGFTLIEIIVVISIVLVLIVVTASPLSSFRNKQALQNSTNAVLSVLNDSRAKTFAAVGNTFYSVKLDTDKVTMFLGGSYTEGLATNEILFLEYPVTQSWNLQGSGSVVTFDRLKGSTSQYGTITISLPGGLAKTITISSLGSIVRN